MGIIDKLRELFSGGSNSQAPTAAESQMDGLAEKMADKRGDNISISEGQGNFAPNRDGMKNLTDAAKDARIVNMSVEDKSLSEMKDYKSTRD